MVGVDESTELWPSANFMYHFYFTKSKQFLAGHFRYLKAHSDSLQSVTEIQWATLQMGISHLSMNETP